MSYVVHLSASPHDDVTVFEGEEKYPTLYGLCICDEWQNEVMTFMFKDLEDRNDFMQGHEFEMFDDELIMKSFTAYSGDMESGCQTCEVLLPVHLVFVM